MDALQTVTSTQALKARYTSKSPRLSFALFSLLTVAVLVWAWLVRDHRYLQAETGLGYGLGIVGASLMLVLLLYPARKRWRFMRGWLNLKSWFRLHMVLGVLGPVCILLHSNFQLGSTNSTVALVAMLLVAGSGLVGRYFYGKFHDGIYGRQVGLQQIKTDLDTFYRQLDFGGLDEERHQQLDALYSGACEIIVSQQQAVSLRQLLRQRRWLRQAKRRAISSAAMMSTDTEQLARDRLRALASLLAKLAGLRLFERLFGIWHIVHIPVFLLMIVTAVVHVLVVHWY